MTASFPPPDATAAEVAAWHKANRAAVTRSRRQSANLSANSVCRSCGGLGHRRGVKSCPNWDTPWRRADHGRVWREGES